MDILLQYLNIRTQKQDFVKITDVPCYSVFQSIHQEFELNISKMYLISLNSLHLVSY